MSDSQDEISTEPELARTGQAAGLSAPSPGSSSCPSCSRGRLVLKLAHVGGVLGFLAWMTPWAIRRYEGSDWYPMAGVAGGLLMVITRANILDVAKAVGSLLPWGKGGK